MSPYALLSRLPLAAALVAAPFALNPAMAQEQDDIVFAQGTGNADYVGSSEYEADGPDYRDDESSIDDVADRMSDPAMQSGVAETVERATAAMMNVPIGPLADAIEQARPGTVNRRIRRDSTIGDLAGRDAAYLPEELADRSRDMMGMMGGFARAMSSMMPGLERMSREMEESFRTAKAQARRY